jgi:hypothetical protein
MVWIMLHTIVHDEELAIATHESAGNLKQKLCVFNIRSCCDCYCVCLGRRKGGWEERSNIALVR